MVNGDGQISRERNWSLCLSLKENMWGKYCNFLGKARNGSLNIGFLHVVKLVDLLLIILRFYKWQKETDRDGEERPKDRDIESDREAHGDLERDEDGDVERETHREGERRREGDIGRENDGEREG